MQPEKSVVGASEVVGTRMYSANPTQMMSWIERAKYKKGTHFAAARTFYDAFLDFGYDIGKTDFYHSAIGYVSLVIYSLFYIVSASGYAIPNIDRDQDEIGYYFFKVFTYVATFCPDTYSNLTQCTVALQILIIVVAQLAFTIYLVKRYQTEDYPPTALVDFWMAMGRLISPLFSCYVGYIAADGIVLLISGRNSDLGIMFTVLGVPSLFFQLVLVVTNALVLTSTPLMRKNDPISLWYAYSYFEVMAHGLIIGTSILQRILNLLHDHVLAASIHLCVNSMSGIGCIVFLFLKIPMTRPRINAFVISIFFFTTLLGMSPLLALKTNFLGYALIIFVLLFLVSIYFTGLIMTGRIRYALRKFYKWHYEMDKMDEDDEMMGMNVFCDLGEKRVEPTIADYGFTKPSETEVAIRLGFLYSINDAVASKFLQSVFKAFKETSVTLAICQVLAALETDSNFLMTVCKSSQYDIKKAMGGTMFLRLVNDLRLQKMSHKNQPLLDSFAMAKKATKALGDDLGNFWTAALKGRTDMMINFLPVVAVRMARAENMYEKVVRNFQSTPLVLPEIANFYHKSIGDHRKCVIFQSMFHKSKKLDLENLATTTTTTTLQIDDNVDKAFLTKMEPYMAAQDAVMGVKSLTVRIFLATMIVSFIGYLAIQLIVLGIATRDLGDFQNNFTPVQTISDLLYSLVRLLQLFRRRNLCEVDDVVDQHITSTGPVLSTLLEFITVDKIMPSIEKHLANSRRGSELLLDYCKRSSKLKATCEAKNYTKISGASETKVTIYEMFSAMNTAMSAMVNASDWSVMQNDDNMKFIFQNFEECYQSVSVMITVLEDDLLIITNRFKTTCFALLGVVWLFPALVLIPLTIVAMSLTKKELRAICRLICHFPKNELSSLRRFTNSSTKDARAAKSEMMTSKDETTNQNQDELSQKVVDSLVVTRRTRVGMYETFINALACFIAYAGIISSIGIGIFYFFAEQNIDLAINTFRLYRVSASSPSSYIFFQELWAKEKILGYSVNFLKERASFYMGRLRTNFNGFIFGETTYSRKPAVFMGADVQEHFIMSDVVVDTANIYSPVNGFLHSVYFSESCDSEVRMMDDCARYLLNLSDTSVTYTFNDEFVYHFEHLIFAHLDRFFQEGRVLMQDNTSAKLIFEKEILVIVFATMIVIMVICYFTIFLPGFVIMKKKILVVRNLMLLIDPTTILKTQSVMRWISGQTNQSTRAEIAQGQVGQEFVEHIVNNSRCGLAIMDKNLSIDYYNHFTAQVFRGTENLVGQNILQLLETYLMDPKKSQQIKRLEEEVQKMLSGRNHAMTYEFKSSVLNAQGSNMYISISLFGHQEPGRDDIAAGAFSVVIADRTTEYYQEALVADEKRKGDNLIASLLPPVIIQRMNEGEKDISFEVQTATVCFTSVCNWNQVIEDMNAVEVVKFLNVLYSEYDKELKNFPEITKLKTIGHIYMIAAGLFSEFNCADVMLNYCLKCMNIVSQVIEETGITFKISMGVNTGGPVNCGILGHTRPVFDILGDVVNVSSRMNSSCIPGCIQISESTYDCVKFLTYQIRERGEISVKGKGKMKTFFVSAAQQAANSNNV